MTLEHRIELLTQAVQHLAQIHGARLTRKEVLERMRMGKNGIPLLMSKGFPKPMPDGKWLLSEVIEWETSPQNLPTPHR